MNYKIMMGKGKHINMETLTKICETLNCGIWNVIALESDSNGTKQEWYKAEFERRMLRVFSCIPNDGNYNTGAADFKSWCPFSLFFNKTGKCIGIFK